MFNFRKRGAAMIRRGNYDASQAFEDAWESRDRTTSASAEVRDLVRTAELICRSAAVEPSAEFRATLRDRLMDEAADVLVADPAPLKPTRSQPHRPAPSRRRRRLAGLTAALVASVGVVGTVASSASAVPGDLLYPVKRGVENVQVAFHRDDASRGEYRLQQARERLAEAQSLDARGETDRMASTLDDFTSQAQEGTDDLFDAYESDRSTKNIDKVNDFVADASVTLASLSASMPTDAEDSFASATTLISGLATQASDLCASCTSADISSLVDAVDALTGSTADPIAQLPPEATSGPASVTDPIATLIPELPATTGSGTSGSSKGGTGSSSGGSSGLIGTVGDTLDAVAGEDGLVPNLLGGLLGGGKK